MARINAQPAFTRYLNAHGHPLTRAESKQALARWRRHWDEHGFGLWAVEERESGRLVGRVGVQYHSLWPQDPEVGWGLDPAVWGRGYATEAGAAAIGHAFETLGVPRLVSIVHPGNRASIAVQERLGIHPWREIPWPGTGVLLEVRAIERTEWAAVQSSR